MARWMLVVEANCTDPSGEKEFNEWYDKVHLPDVLELPGILSASRYEKANLHEGQCKFLALYEVETEDMKKVWATIEKMFPKWSQQGRMSKHIKIGPIGFYRQITPPVKRK